ncbi:MAG: transcription termination factor NusA [Deltaproteobacteria bacterium]|nr:transcription termination factor NusA [Deltaproteobacteria bacterium]
MSEESIETFKLNIVLDTLSKEKSLDKEVLIDALKQAMLTAARKKLGLTADLEARYDTAATMEEVLQRHGQYAVLAKMKEGEKKEAVGLVRIYEFKKVVKDVNNHTLEISLVDARQQDPDLTDEDIGIDLGIEVWSKEFGRIAAQTAKQVIIQRVREAERNTIFTEYKDRKGEIVSGIARRFERGNVIVELGRAEAVLPIKEQIPRENIRTGDKVVAYVLDVLEMARGPQIVLSRAHPNLVVKLFEQNVPEIADGVVTVEAAAREAGVRTKIAVRSSDSDVDPVGACVGMKGARVQAVVQELRGEKIDIVPWDEDEARFVCNALSPAEVTRVLVDEANHTMQIVVPDDQLSLAIGRRGQNVRLAAQLSGWKIDITSETKVAEEREVAWASLSRIEGISDFVVQTLYNHGFRRAAEVVEADDEFLGSLPGFNPDAVPRIKASAKDVVKAEKSEKLEVRELARGDARILLAIERACEATRAAGKTDLERLKALDGVLPYVIERLQAALYDAPEDLYFEHDDERLINVGGFSAGKARQLKYAASLAVNALTNGVAPILAKPLSEPEARDAQSYDAAQTAVVPAAPAVEAAPA